MHVSLAIREFKVGLMLWVPVPATFGNRIKA